MSVGVRIKELRNRLGITQPELAEKIGVHETTIRRWERGTDKKGIDAEKAMKLAEVLGTTTESLLSDDEDIEDSSVGEERILVYEWGGADKITLPNTPEGRELFERIVTKALTKGHGFLTEEPTVATA